MNLPMTTQYLLPVLLSIGAIWLATQECYTYTDERRRGLKSGAKLFRRLLGSLILLVIAVGIHYGDIEPLMAANAPPPGPVDQAQTAKALACLDYWTTIVGLVVVAIILALWDMISSMRGIRHMVEEAQNDEIAALCQQIQKQQKKRQPPAK